jgi:solute:Na+ symporter, SSS family
MSSRSLSALQVAVLLVSASYGIGFLFGSGEMALSHGMGGALYGLATAAGMLILALFARRLWTRGLPIWDLFGERFGAAAQRAVALLSLVWMAGVLAAQIHGGAAVVRLLGLPATWDHLLVLALIYVASQLDLGVASRLCGACLLASAAVLGWALVASGGVDLYRDALPVLARDLSSFDPLRVVTTTLAVSVLVCLGADYHQFVIGARRPEAAVLGCGLAGLALLLVACVPPAVVVAMQRAGALEGLADAKQVMPFLLARVAASMGPGAYTVMLATLGLAALGSAAAIVRAMTAALNAVVPRALPSAHRVLPVAALLTGALLAARGQEIIDTMVSVNVVYIASVAVPFVALLGRRGIPAFCVLAALAAGFVAASGAYAAGWWGWIDAARVDAVSLVGGLAASLLAVAVSVACDRRRLPIVEAPSA